MLLYQFSYSLSTTTKEKKDRIKKKERDTINKFSTYAMKVGIKYGSKIVKLVCEKFSYGLYQENSNIL